MCPVEIGAGFAIPTPAMVITIAEPPVQEAVLLGMEIVWSVVPLPGVITGVPQLAGVQPVMDISPAPTAFKSKPLVVTPELESGIPLLPLALSAMGMVINKLPSLGTADPVVKETVQVPACVATA